MANKNKIVAARVGESDAIMIARVSSLRGENISAFVRRSIKRELARLSFLSEEERKALDVQVKKVECIGGIK